MKHSTNEVINYFQKKESRWGYTLVLGGIKHFGYYPDGQRRISMQAAMHNMMDRVGESLALKPKSTVLDAGCGEGATAEHLAKNFDLNVEGVDLLDSSIKKAKKRVTPSTKNLRFKIDDYSRLSYPDNYFDGIYTLETLVHSPNYVETLSEFRRVLKKNGKLVLFEYSMPEEKTMSEEERRIFKTIIEGSAMHSFPNFTHGSFPAILSSAGFKNCKVNNITKNITPMMKRFWMLGFIPYQFIKLFGKEKKFVNTTSGVELYKHRDKIHYNIVTATNA